MAVWYIWITKTLFVEHSRQVKVFVSRIFSITVEHAYKLVIAFLFVSNHSTWSIGFPAAPALVQALYSSDVGALYSHTRVASYTYHSWNICGKFKNRRRRESYRFQRRALRRAEINCFLRKSDKFAKSHLVITAISKKGETSEESWSTLTDSDSAILVRILTIAIFACVSGQRTSCLFLFFFSLFPDEN